MARYGFNTVQLSLPGLGAKQLALPGNPDRVSLILSSTVNGIIGVSYFNGSGNIGIYWTKFGNQGNPMTFGVFGPLIQYEVWLQSLTATTLTTFATEVFKLGNC